MFLTKIHRRNFHMIWLYFNVKGQIAIKTKERQSFYKLTQCKTN